MLEIGAVRVALAERRVIDAAGEVTPLTEMEARLLEHLVARRGHDVPREELLTEVWGYDAAARTRTVDNMVRKLRKKLREPPGRPRVLRTVPGGYRLVLPASPGALIGRGALVASVRAATQRHAWVTLVGPAGVGKSRVAQAVVEALDEPLIQIDVGRGATADALAEQVAAALGAGRIEGDPVEVVEALARTAPPTRIWIEGLEGALPDAAPALSRWIDATGSLRWLATSRRDVAVAGAVRIEVPLLSLDAARALFVQRARRRRPAFEPGGALDALLEGLDRLPLALELAAARVDVLSVSQQVAHLEQRLEWLTGPQGALQQALEASWARLTPDERDVLGACTVFHGAFSVERALAVAEVDALAPLLSLRDASWIQARRGSDPVELRLLDSVRSFVIARWGGDASVPRAALRASLAAAPLRPQEPERWAPVVGDLRVAFWEALEDEPGVAAALALRLDRALLLAGTLRERAEILERALALAPEVVGLRISRGHVALLRGALDQAWAQAEAAVAVADAPPSRALADRFRGVLLWRRGALDEAEALLERSARTFEAEGMHDECAATLKDLVPVLEHRDGPGAARRALDRALDAIERCEPLPRRLLGVLELSAGNLDQRAGRHAEAYVRLGQAAAWLDEIGDANAALVARGGRVSVLLEQGADEEAQALGQQVVDDALRCGRASLAAAMRGNLGVLQLAQGQLAEGTILLRDVLRQTLARGWRHDVGLARQQLATALILSGHLPEALEELQHARGSSTLEVMTEALSCVVWLLEGGPGQAAEHARRASALAEQHPPAASFVAHCVAGLDPAAAQRLLQADAPSGLMGRIARRLLCLVVEASVPRGPR